MKRLFKLPIKTFGTPSRYTIIKITSILNKNGEPSMLKYGSIKTNRIKMPKFLMKYFK